MIRCALRCLFFVCLTGSALAADESVQSQPVMAIARHEAGEQRPSSTPVPPLDEKAEYFAIDGPIVDRVATRDSDQFKRDITRIGMMVHYASPFEFVTVGVSRDEFRQGDWSASVDSVILAGRKLNRRTGEGFTARIGATTNTDHVNWHGEGTWNIRFSEQTGIELIGNRDAVETPKGLEQRILSNFVAVSLDHALTDRLTVIAMPTYRQFTDDNTQRGGRAWLIYGLLPSYGLSVELKAQAYESTGDSQGIYFSPDFYERAEIGMRLRHAIGHWRVFASAHVGKEIINHEIDKPTSAFAFNTQRSFDNKLTIGLQFSYYRTASTATSIEDVGAYSWRMGRIFVMFPLP
jgi:hypothetical protein